MGAALVLFGALAMAAAGYYAATGRLGGIAEGPAVEKSGGAPAAGEIFKLSFRQKPRAVPDLRFADAEGHALSLADFRGRPLVLNLWATWCLPCRKEMPTLDRLQTEFDKRALTVLPLSIDRQGAAAVQSFYRQLGVKALEVYVDPSGKAADAVAAVGIPTTLLIDREGREIGRKIGPADWDSPAMIGLLRDHLGISQPGRKNGS